MAHTYVEQKRAPGKVVVVLAAGGYIVVLLWAAFIFSVSASRLKQQQLKDLDEETFSLSLWLSQPSTTILSFCRTYWRLALS